MRKHAAAIVCVTVGVLTLVGSPTARADDESFLRDVEPLGVTLSSPNVVSTARSACSMLRYNNRIPSEIQERIQRYLRVEADKAHEFFVLAIREYCPEYTPPA